ncbi:MAG: hypothetical protein A2Y78_15545 [Acidobacteria bacterium RBG_13_68_16]|jgi:hypothetical protein|nr:MAG: hypothetical protein A2Y78_15545 [Acidobacteria bacterium RBG_13_68_16]
MNEEPGSFEKLLAGLRPPEPPRGLQDKTLRGAGEALAREAGRDFWTRIWESRPLRVAWAVSAGVLVICHIGITELPSGRAPAARQTALSARDGDGELAAIGRLLRLDEGARPLIGTEAYRVVEEQETDRTLLGTGNGKESAS